VPELSLNFCAFTDLLHPAGSGWRRVARPVLLALDRLFQLERLYVFNRKFFPEWRPRYLCVERLSDLPGSGSRTCTSSRCSSRRARGRDRVTPALRR
jgi:lysylphosphatidylglycerol synthetase-like protein (DUF2156 family)